MEVNVAKELTELRNKLDGLERKILELEREKSVKYVPYIIPAYPCYRFDSTIYCSNNTKGGS